MGTLAVVLSLLSCTDMALGQSDISHSYNAPSYSGEQSNSHREVSVTETDLLSQTDINSDADITEDDESDGDASGIDSEENQSIADSGLQQLLDALNAEPDLGPIPLEPLDAETPAVSPYRLFVDMEVRGTSNAGYLPFDRDRDGDAVFTPSLTFVAVPSISGNAQLVASLSAGTSIYANESDLAFGYFAGAIGVNWDFAPFWFTRVELQGQQVLAYENDDYQSLALQYQLGRAHVFTDSSLYLRYFYQLRGNLTNDSDLDRIGNSLNASALFPLNHRLQGRILYRLLLDSFANDSRTDVNNRIRGEVRYAINDILSVRGFTAYTNNMSTDGDRDYDDVSIGVGFTANFPLGEGR